MSVEAEYRAEYACIILRDDLPFRRAGIKSLLENWVREDGCELDTVETTCG